MNSPDLIPADRLEQILAGAAPEGARERHVAGLARELRADAPAAPETVRTRVRESAARVPTPTSAVSRFRPALALAAALMLALVAAAGISSLADRGDSGGGESAVSAAAQQDPEVARREPARGRALPTVATKDTPPPAEWRRAVLRGGATSSNSAGAFAAPGRVRDVEASLRLRVRDAERLSDVASDAMRITRSLGGFVAYVDVDTAGNDGRATLTLRVPVGRVQDAIVRLSDLGTITGQHVSVTDRQVEVDQLARRVETLRLAVARTRRALARTAPGSYERERLQLLLERQRGLLNRLTRRRGRIVREASFARIDLSVVTGKAPKGATGSAGRFERAARDGLHVLSAAAAAALFLAILLSPLLIAAALAGIALRARRRRIEERLLERLAPAGHAAQPAPDTGA